MLSILMATHNGSLTLPRVLESYKYLDEPPGGWRLIVINNNSNDDTLAILNDFKKILPMDVLNCDKRGKNVALNFGLRFVQGDLIVFTDDDIVPDRNWLVKYREAADRNVAYSIFGGRIDPVWPSLLPKWILQFVNLGATYGITPRNLPTGPAPASQIWGANMAIRAKVFSDGYQFNEAVGPNEGQYIMGSEVEFTGRMERAGHMAWWIEDAIVGHIIREYQVERKWIVQRAFRLGRHMYHQEILSTQPDVLLLFGAPRWKYKQLLLAISRYIKGFLFGSFNDRFAAEWDLYFLRGYIFEAYLNHSKK